jgi:hypothetical protein
VTVSGRLAVQAVLGLCIFGGTADKLVAVWGGGARQARQLGCFGVLGWWSDGIAAWIA